MNVQPLQIPPAPAPAQALRTAAEAAPAAPADGYTPGEASVLKKGINALAWGSGGFLGGMALYPATRWLAMAGVGALGAAGASSVALAVAQIGVPVLTVAATSIAAGVVGWRTAQA